MFNKKTIKDTEVKDKVVIVRVDYNVPMEDGKITSDLRIRASIPTIKYLHENGAKKIILVSHMGRPEGKNVPELSLKPIADALRDIINSEITTNTPGVFFTPEVSGEKVEIFINNIPDGSIVLMENLRFFPEEEKNDEAFAKSIVDSVKADLFVQDGFAVIHRGHASTEAITHILPSVAGMLVEKEVSTLKKSVESPEHPVLVIIGGAKVDDKQPLIDTFANIADQIIVVGKIAADGYTPDESIASKVYVAEDFKVDEEGRKLDIGEVSIEKCVNLIQGAKTIVWNGTAGLVEKPEYTLGSNAIAEAIGHKTDATTIICGGDTAGFIENYTATSTTGVQYSLVSTGGGASLELLSGLPLPGVDSLQDK